MSDLPPRDEWIATDHPRVYYASESDIFDRGELRMVKWLAEKVEEQYEGWEWVITMGPYRLEYAIHPRIAHEHDRTIHVDCYSAAFAVYGPGSVRKHHPAVAHAEDILYETVHAIHEFEGGLKDI